ncbi:MAG: hypothetical protein LYZ69_05620 [Nitrososphaerales archaeon]|nr:hypothetical protein [Nitrososphaerales archaeon]
MSIKVSPISRTAAILIIVLGVLTFLLVNSIAGVAFIALGAFLYLLLYRFGAKLARELEETKGQSA